MSDALRAILDKPIPTDPVRRILFHNRIFALTGRRLRKRQDRLIKKLKLRTIRQIVETPDGVLLGVPGFGLRSVNRLRMTLKPFEPLCSPRAASSVEITVRAPRFYDIDPVLEALRREGYEVTVTKSGDADESRPAYRRAKLRPE